MTQTQQQQIGLVIGSLRKGSLSRQIGEQLMRHAPAIMEFVDIPIDLPLFCEDLEATPPAAWEEFRAGIAGCDAVLFVSPEYNRSIPGGLKNAIDVGSRPYGRGALLGKPAAVVTQAPGPVGASLSNHVLRQSLVCLNMPTMPAPEMYIPRSRALFDDQGELRISDQMPPFEAFMTAFSAWVARHGRG